MALNSRQAIRSGDLEKSLGIYVPPEGGYEGRYRFSTATAGCVTFKHLRASGLGDGCVSKSAAHGVRPPAPG